MNPRSSFLLCLLASGLGLSACSLLRSARDTAHYYVLAPMAGAGHDLPQAPSSQVAFGVGKVKIPSYLLRDPLAVRRGTNEIRYLEGALWAERLDNALQRVLAENLACLLTTDQVRLSAWAKEEVQFEIYVSIERFDVNADGHGEISAWWRILSPGASQTLKTGQFHHERAGPQPIATPEGSVATLSLLAEDLSRDLAKTVAALQGRP